MSNRANRFVEWLDEQENRLGLSDYEIAKRGKFSHSVLSRARAGIPPKWDVCVSVAEVVKVPPEQVFRMAGLLPLNPDEDEWDERIQHLLRKFPPEEKKKIVKRLELEAEFHEPPTTRRSTHKTRA